MYETFNVFHAMLIMSAVISAGTLLLGYKMSDVTNRWLGWNALWSIVNIAIHQLWIFAILQYLMGSDFNDVYSVGISLVVATVVVYLFHFDYYLAKRNSDGSITYILSTVFRYRFSKKYIRLSKRTGISGAFIEGEGKDFKFLPLQSLSISVEFSDQGLKNIYESWIPQLSADVTELDFKHCIEHLLFDSIIRKVWESRSKEEWFLLNTLSDKDKDIFLSRAKNLFNHEFKKLLEVDPDTKRISVSYKVREFNFNGCRYPDPNREEIKISQNSVLQSS